MGYNTAQKGAKGVTPKRWPRGGNPNRGPRGITQVFTWRKFGKIMISEQNHDIRKKRHIQKNCGYPEIRKNCDIRRKRHIRKFREHPDIPKKYDI